MATTSRESRPLPSRPRCPSHQPDHDAPEDPSLRGARTVRSMSSAWWRPTENDGLRCSRGARQDASTGARGPIDAMADRGRRNPGVFDKYAPPLQLARGPVWYGSGGRGRGARHRSVERAASDRRIGAGGGDYGQRAIGFFRRDAWHQPRPTPPGSRARNPLFNQTANRW